MTSRRERKTCFWHLLVSEKCQLLAWPHSSCWGSSSTEWYVSQFFKKSTVSQFLMNNFIVPENLHLQTFIMVIREGKKYLCVYIFVSLLYFYTHMCVHVYLHTWTCRHFLTTFTASFTTNCPSVTTCVYLAYVTSHVTDTPVVCHSEQSQAPRKAKCTCIVCKLISGK